MRGRESSRIVLRMTVAIKKLSSFAALLPKQVFSVPTSEIVRNRFVLVHEAAENEDDKEHRGISSAMMCSQPGALLMLASFKNCGSLLKGGERWGQ
jgi:hypothetical protein